MSALWYACEEPERPPDPYIEWHYAGCRGCRMKLEFTQRLHPEDGSVTNLLWVMDKIEALKNV